MTSNLGIDWYATSGNYAYKRNQWAAQANRMANSQANNNYNGYTTTNPSLSTSNQAQTDVLSLSHTSGCTDGVDDGKIGLTSAVGNIAKGVGKTVVNAVKGALGFQSDGTWSPLKLAKTVAIGAACTAFPAVGLVLATGGIGVGAFQIAKGVGNAMNASTDAEAKSAWQNVGAGAFTTAASVIGAKASYKGVVNSAGNGKLAEFASKHNVEDVSNLGSMLKAAKGNKLEFAEALGKDMFSSTKNNLNKITGFVKNSSEASQLSKAEKNMNDAKKALDEAQKPEAKTSTEQLKKLQENYDKAKADYDTKNTNASSDVKDLKETRAQKQAAKKQAKADSKSVKELEKLEKQAKAAEKQATDAKAAGKDTTKFDKAATEARTKYDEALNKANDNVKAGNNLAKLREYVSENMDDLDTPEVANMLKDAEMSASDAARACADQFAAETAKTNSFSLLKTLESVKNIKISELPANISAQTKTILTALQNSKYNSVVSQYGYTNVAEALSTFAALQVIDNDI